MSKNISCTVNMANICTNKDIKRVPIDKADKIKIHSYLACDACAEYLAHGFRRIPNASTATIRLLKLQAMYESQKLMHNPDNLWTDADLKHLEKI